jgi:poly-gamma-glutamate synthesis protein (capsule biosynthesis protein)
MRYVFLFFLILVVAVLGGLSLTTISEPYAYGNPVASLVITPVAVVPDPLPLTILFTGDVMLARRSETLMDAYGGDFPYRRLPFLQELADTVVVNFEAAAPTRHIHTPDLTFRFSVDALYVASLKESGVTHAGLANNHAYDTGIAGFVETNDTLFRNSITPFGGGVIASTSMVIIEQASTSVALVAINLVDEKLAVEALSELLSSASTTDYQIAYIHWGTEYRVTHSLAQEVSAQKLIELGFDGIIGHHPHVVQDVDMLDGVPVFYSLGNFIFDQYFSSAVQEGLLVHLEATKEALTFTLLPHTSVDARTQPRLLLGEEKATFLEKLTKTGTTSTAEMVAAGVITISKTGCNSCVID